MPCHANARFGSALQRDRQDRNQPFGFCETRVLFLSFLSLLSSLFSFCLLLLLLWCGGHVRPEFPSMPCVGAQYCFDMTSGWAIAVQVQVRRRVWTDNERMGTWTWTMVGCSGLLGKCRIVQERIGRMWWVSGLAWLEDLCLCCCFEDRFFSHTRQQDDTKGLTCSGKGWDKIEPVDGVG